MSSDAAIVEKMNLVAKRGKQLFDKQAVDVAIAKVGQELSRDLASSRPIFLSVMQGAVYFLGQLLPHCDFPLQVDYVHASRYRGKTTGGILNWIVKPSSSLVDREIVIIDDILDAGITLQAIVDYCYEVGAGNVRTAVLVDKGIERPSNGVQTADYTGLVVPDEYVYGSGMDYHDYLRNIPGIYSVHPDDM